ncbi:CLUMA_CG011315, isoform A [Clunio marinus]|uniref:CLUMA_CG011315, isoform A n=1 Tax=Clunio marinus TaxID=568069 RepID=A0A1J1IFX9_9DIPT|nr:CLUMA_CG011315, isoform A [Clunio marinus]
MGNISLLDEAQQVNREKTILEKKTCAEVQMTTEIFLEQIIIQKNCSQHNECSVSHKSFVIIVIAVGKVMCFIYGKKL